MKNKASNVLTRVTSLLLALIMTFGAVPATVYAAEEPQRLETTMPDLPEGLAEGQSVFCFGTAQVDLPENGGSYILTVFRLGDTSTEQHVTLYSADVSAKYGEDYRIRLDGIVESPAEKTLIEQNAEESAARESAEAVDYVQSLVDSSSDENAEGTIEDYLDDPDDILGTGAEKSGLAALKEA